MLNKFKYLFIVLFILAIPNIALGAQTFMPPVVGNIDASTISDEILTTTFDGRLYAWKSERTLAEGSWPKEFDGVICASPTLADIDSDPSDLEIIVPVCDYSGNYKLYGLQGNGSEVGSWIKDLNFEVYSSPSIGYIDINGDKKKEKILFIGSRDGRVFAWTTKPWETLPGWPKALGSSKVVSPFCADIDSDGNDEVIVTTGSGKIITLDYNNNKWEQIGVLDIHAGIASSGIVADLDRDGTKELVVGSANGTIYVWSFNSKDKKWASKWSLSTGGSPLSKPVAANFDTDKELELVCYSGEGKIQIINNNGTLLSNASVSNVETSGVGQEGLTLPEILTNKFFYSYYATNITAVKKGNPSVTITEWGLFHHYRQPYVLNLLASVDPFSPNGDGRKDTTIITSQIGSPQECDIKLGIYDNKSQLVKKIKDARYKPSGVENFLWDGKGDQSYNKGQPVDSETYNILLELESAYSDQVNQLNTVTVDTIPPVVSNVSETLKIIIPDEDGKDEETTISYAVSEPCDVTITFKDSKGKVYKSHKEFLDTRLDPVPNTIHKYTWDGKGNANQLFSGEYTYTIVAEDLAANLGSSEARTIIVDVDPPLINGVYAEPEIFSTKSSINSTTIHYAISEDSDVSIAVYTSEDTLVKTLLTDEMKSLGTHEIVWDGTNDADIHQPDGYYTYKISAVDLRGFKSSTIKAVVEIDSTPPSILQKTVIPSEFSPKASTGTTTTLSFLVSEKAKVTIDVLNSVDTVIKTLTEHEQVDAGTHSYIWDGKDKDGVAVSDGTYRFKITAEDEAGNIKVSTTNVIANSTPPSISNASDGPDPFTPNSDSLIDISRIHYTLSGGIGDVKVTVKILNSTGSSVKTLVDNELYYSGNYTEYWYGGVDVKGGIADVNGDGIVDDGVYTYQIVAVDSHGNRAAAEGEITAIPTKPTLNISADPTKFSPNSDGAIDTTLFSYSVDYASYYIPDPATITIDIKNASNQTVFTQSFSHTPGNYTFEWDGKKNDGTDLDEGIYTVILSGYDALGTYSDLKSIGVEIVYTNTTITILGDSPDPFSPVVNGNKDTTIISYSLSKPSTVTIQIKDFTDSLVKILQNEELEEKEITQTIVWDGKDSSDTIVSDGAYTYVIIATDDAGNTSSASNSVIVDDTPPSAPILDTISTPSNQQVQTVSGTAEANSYVEIFNSGNVGASITAASAFGTEVNLSLGDNLIKARTTDIAGNVSEFCSEQLVHYETDLPIISNISATPNPAKAGTVDISFIVSEALKNNPEVLITQTGRSASFSSQSGLGYTFEYTVLSPDPQGDNTISITIVDLAGNSNTNESGSVVVDTIAPDSPEVNDITSPTNIQKQTVSGIAEANTHIKIYNNGDLIQETDADADGSFTKDINLILGTNQITVIAIDDAFNESASSPAKTVVFDTTAPVFTDVSVSPNPAKAGTATITFTVSKDLESNPILTVNGNSADFSSAVGYDYTYTYDVTGSDDQGTAAISIEATDLASNTGYGIGYFTIDTIDPDVTDISVAPDPAKEGSAAISFAVSENLLSSPTVSVLETSRNVNFFSKSGLNYTYTYNIESNDPQGFSTVSINVVDLAQNSHTDNSFHFTVDTVSPVLSNINITPDPAKGGTTTITFDVSETLDGNPSVTVNGKGASIDPILSSGLSYTYTYDVISTDKQGEAAVQISGIDPAGNIGNASSQFVIDTIKPEITNIAASPYQAKAETVTITFTVSESLDNLRVKVNDNLATFSSETKISESIINYTYSYNVTSFDKQGTADILVEATDYAGNVGEGNGTFIIDTQDPTFDDITATPNPAKVGNVTISFTASETLASNPIVKINGNNATFDSSSGLNYVYIYPVTLVDDNGDAAISISGIDLAGNTGIDNTGSFVIDTEPPSFNNITIAPNPAKAGSLTFSFTASETLKADPAPTVTVNSNPATFDSFIGLDYSFIYNVTDSDKQGAAEIIISGEDLAGNTWTDNTGSLIIDTEPPTLTINGKGANPNPFTPNMLETTSFDFSVSDITTTAKVNWIKIYNSNGDLVKTLGEGQVTWDGKVDGGVSDSNGDGLADEGTYTFEIHTIDNALNETTKTGTLLVNRIVLHLEEPAAPTKKVNPTPFSPTVLPETIITFVLDQDSNGPSWPSGFSVMGIKASGVDPVGTVKIEVRTTGGSLVKTLLPNASDDGKREAGTHQVTWNGRNDSGQIVSSGSYKIIITAKDLVGNPAENESSLTYDIVIDTVPPSGSIKIDNNAQYTTDLSVNLNLSASDTHSSVVKMRISNDGNFDNEPTENYTTSKSWALSSGSEGSRTVYVKYQDEAGNWSGSFSDSITFDETSPGISISSISPNPFNQMYESANITYNLSDNIESQVYVEAQVFTSTDTYIGTIRRYSDGLVNVGNGKQVSWNGQNSDNDYVNVGNYKVKIRAKDQAGNESGFVVSNYFSAKDDLRLTNNSVSSNPPSIGVNGNNVHVTWRQEKTGGWSLIYYKRSTNSGASWGSEIKFDNPCSNSEDSSIGVNGNNVHVVWEGSWGGSQILYKRSTDNGANWGGATIITGSPKSAIDPSIGVNGNNIHVVWRDGRDGNRSKVFYKRSTDNGANWGSDTQLTVSESISPAIGVSGNNLHVIGQRYYTYARSTNNGTNWDSEKGFDVAWGSKSIAIAANGNNVHVIWQKYIVDNWEICYKKSTNNGASWGSKVRLTNDSSDSIHPSILVNGNDVHIVWIDGKAGNHEVYYRKSTDNGSSWGSEVRLTNDSSDSVYPAIGINSSNDCYIVWLDNRNGDYEVYFQKIPYNFAPLNGSATALSIRTPGSQPLITAQTIIPVLIAPADETKVSTIRPTFEWQGIKEILEYQIQCSKGTNFTTYREFKKTVTSSEASPENDATPCFIFEIHEFDEGLEVKDTLGDPVKWYWRVGAVKEDGTDTWSHEPNDMDLWYFTIELPLSISRVNNYPNPFNPDDGATMIRYKLGCDVDEVKIRIYDITGALVKELDGETEAEGPDIWTEKYHDIPWDGKNGMGDTVVNGIYPFEVIATNDGKSVSGRGKIAVLK